jgi:hypothetical protein
MARQETGRPSLQINLNETETERIRRILEESTSSDIHVSPPSWTFGSEGNPRTEHKELGHVFSRNQTPVEEAPQFSFETGQSQKPSNKYNHSWDSEISIDTSFENSLRLHDPSINYWKRTRHLNEIKMHKKHLKN